MSVARDGQGENGGKPDAMTFVNEAHRDPDAIEGLEAADDFRFVSIRDLQRNTRKVIEDAIAERRPVIITRRGEAAAILHALDTAKIREAVHSMAENFMATRELAEKDIANGLTRTSEEMARELGVPFP